MCLPDKEKEKARLGRQYLINCCYTRMGEKFKAWVDLRVNARHEKIKKDQNKFVEMDPQIHKLFMECKSISVNKGSAY